MKSAKYFKLQCNMFFSVYNIFQDSNQPDYKSIKNLSKLIHFSHSVYHAINEITIKTKPNIDCDEVAIEKLSNATRNEENKIFIYYCKYIKDVIASRFILKFLH